ncbi:SGNH/GDSL hydrolase family protein [Corynebacterium sp. LK2510]|uniref:SGNH/GDSL hydrolase family protein n=1 Tax=Corynebacterium sp. LK2510 TaxID=3110472 RepID=UPI0034CD63BA
MTIRRFLVGAVTALAALSSIAPAHAAPVGKYVAIGDSSTAVGSPTEINFSNFESVSCGRSKDNYPNQIAWQLGMPLADVSCAGAVVGHYWNARSKAGQIVPAQRDAIGPDTGLVTIQMGANPKFVSHVAPLCSQAVLGSSGNCAPMGAVVNRGALAEQLTEIVRDARFRAAPGAAIVLLGYLDPLGNPDASCFFTGFMSPEDKRGLQAYIGSVNSVMSEVAAREGVTYVAPPAEASGWCAQPGHRDFSPLGFSSFDNAFPLHPTNQGHIRLANQVVAAVR